jgi:hypothetical protein
LAGSLKRELEDKYGIKPKMKFAHGELDVLVNGRVVFSYKQAHMMPTLDELMAMTEQAASA